MKLYFSIIAWFFVAFASLNAQNYKLRGSALYIMSITEEDSDQIKSEIKDKKNLNVYIEKECKGESFDLFCEIYSEAEKISIREYNGYSLKNLGLLQSLSSLSISGPFHGSDLPDLDLSSLVNTKSLKRITVSKCNFTNLSGLSTHSELESINFYNNTLSCDVNFLSSLSSLTSLKISGIKDYTPLKKLTGLTSLQLGDYRKGNKHLTDEQFSFVKGLKSLKFLGIKSSARITSLNGIEKCTNLESITIEKLDELSDVSALANLTKLKKVVIRGNILTTFPELKKAETLEKLDISYTKITDVSNLKSLKSLKKVFLPLSVVDYASLKKVKSLEVLLLERRATNEQLEIAKGLFPDLKVLKASNFNYKFPK